MKKITLGIIAGIVLLSAILAVSQLPAIKKKFFQPLSAEKFERRSDGDGLNWLYVLTGYETSGLIQKIIDTPAELLVVDAFKTTPDTLFSQTEVREFKKNHKIVLAYMSVGEAEDYRYYWKNEWKQNPPVWLGKINPEWGSFKVRYWHSDWQEIIFGYLDKIIARGFDGAYLDIIDGYEYWADESNGEGEVLEKSEAAKRMVAFIKTIHDYAKQKNGDFKIFPQNSLELARYEGYLEAIDGIGKEDTWYGGYDDINKPESKAELIRSELAEEQIGYLRTIKQAGKFVGVVDYFAPAQSKEAAEFIAEAKAEGFAFYAADTRKLDDISSF